MKKIFFTALILNLLSSYAFAQWSTSGSEIYYNSGNVGIGVNDPIKKLHIYRSDGDANYPSVTSVGDAIQYFKVVNNSLEFGLAGSSNTRRSWILSRHSDLSGSYGMYYSTLHIQPDVGDKTYYRGVAIGFDASSHISTEAHLAVNGKVGIGTISPTQTLHVNGASRFDSWIAGNSSTGSLELYGDQEATSSLIIKDSGNIGIGISFPSEKLEVNGTIRSKKVKVEASGWPDYVFSPNYELKPLTEVENFIQKNRHLPEVPSTKEVKANGLDLGDIEATLLKKVEELTLYTIQQEKRLETSDARYQKLENENSKLKILLLEMKKEIESIKKH
ncbi:hypothetical protein [uncultured Roseivirga sp.]|uniref:hypothetical protein n=1 Tax=uncultured Roseivirga sp. TaxID=543088 RepID=UPI000D79C802|nr:hypothetical protein [uncultured Roseivirga sp.]PWL29728.1 MAG: hypothetical protein DCO95_07745 [Roseivirga sp. XM-24bin3]